jgi:HEAT repeat protein
VTTGQKDSSDLTRHSRSSPELAKRSKRMYVLWSLALTFLISAALFCWLVVVPVWQVKQVVADREYPSKISEDQAVARLGGPHHAREKLALFLRLPEWLVGDKTSAVCLLSICGPEAAPVLVSILGQAEPYGIERELRDAGPTQSAPNALLATAGDGVGEEYTAAQMLHLMEAEAVPALVEALDDRRACVRYLATLILSEIGRDAGPAMEALISNLRDEEPCVRRASAVALGCIDAPSERVVLALKSVANDGNASVRVGVAVGLGYAGGRQAVDLLIAMLQDRNDDVRYAATESLGGVKDERAVTSLVACLQDAESVMRKAAARSLGSSGGPIAVKALRKALTDTDPQVRQAAARALCRASPEDAKGAIPVLVDALGAKQYGRRMSAVKALEMLGSAAADALPALRRLLNDKNSNIRRKAAEALKKIKAAQEKK